MSDRFPFRLHKMIEDAEQNNQEDLICWLPCGTKFKIRNQTEFSQIILAKFCRHSKYKSFLRQLSMYKFRRVQSGYGKGCYHHPHFIKNRVDLAELINREKVIELKPSVKSNSELSNTIPSSSSDSLNSMASSLSPALDSTSSELDLKALQQGCTPKPVFAPQIETSLKTPKDIVDEIIYTFRCFSETTSSEDSSNEMYLSSLWPSSSSIEGMMMQGLMM